MDKHMGPVCPHCGRQDCTVAEIMRDGWPVRHDDGSSPEFGQHASDRQDYLTDECAAAEVRAECLRKRGDVWRRRYDGADRYNGLLEDEAVMLRARAEQAERALSIATAQTGPVHDAYLAEHAAHMEALARAQKAEAERDAEHAEVMRLMAERDIARDNAETWAEANNRNYARAEKAEVERAAFRALERQHAAIDQAYLRLREEMIATTRERDAARALAAENDEAAEAIRVRAREMRAASLGVLSQCVLDRGGTTNIVSNESLHRLRRAAGEEV